MPPHTPSRFFSEDIVRRISNPEEKAVVHVCSFRSLRKVMYGADAGLPAI